MTRKNKRVTYEVKWQTRTTKRRVKGALPPRPKRAWCGKVGYRDEEEAIRYRHSASAAHEQAGAKAEKRSYQCHLCHLWHNTSQAERTSR